MQFSNSCDEGKGDDATRNSVPNYQHDDAVQDLVASAVASQSLQREQHSETSASVNRQSRVASMASDQQQKPVRTQGEKPWDTAYDRLRGSHFELVTLYESKLSSILLRLAHKQDLSNFASILLDAGGENLINQADYETRQSQFREVLQAWFDEDNQDEAQEKRDWTLRSILQGPAMSNPEASLPWLGACLASSMMVLLHSAEILNEYFPNLIDIISRLPWYCNLATLSFVESSEWESELLSLYTAILSFEIHFACLQFQISVDGQSRSSDSLLSGIKDAIGNIDSANNALSALQGYGVQIRLQELLTASQQERLEQSSARHSYHSPTEPATDASASVSTRETSDTDESSESLVNLDVPDPRLQLEPGTQDEARLMEYLTQWVTSVEEFNAFLDWENSRNLLWVSGSSGTGKTALLKSTVQLMENLKGRPGESSQEQMSFFFCGCQPEQVDNAAAVLKTLIWTIVEQQPSLKTHLSSARSLAHPARATHSDDLRDFLILRKVFNNILKDEEFTRTFIVIDSIHKCATTDGRQEHPELLSLISNTLSASSKLQWLVSSELPPSIVQSKDEEKVPHLDLDTRLRDFEMESVVDSYIDYKTETLAKAKEYSSDLQYRVGQCIRGQRTQGDFHWVDLVCARLGMIDNWHALSIVETMPGDLEGLYSHFLNGIRGLPFQDPIFCTELLTTMALVHHSIHVSELAVLLDLRHSQSDIAPVDTLTIAERCQPILEIGDGKVYFRHPSAKNYIQNQGLPGFDGTGGHERMFRRCLDALRSVWHKTDKVTPLDDLKTSNCIGYACTYWIWHLCNVEREGKDRSSTEHAVSFLKTDFSRWVCALGSRSRITTARDLLSDLQKLLQERQSCNNDLFRIARDAHGLLGLHLRLHMEPYDSLTQDIITTTLYAPSESMIRTYMLQTAIPQLALAPLIDHDWSEESRISMGHTDYVRCLAFSPDGRLLASGSDDRTVQIWDAETGAPCCTIDDGIDGWIYCLSISKKELLTFGTDSGTIDFWDPVSGQKYGRWTELPGTVRAVSFSPDSTQLVAAVQETLYVWYLSACAYGEEPERFELGEHSDYIRTLAFSPQGNVLISAGDGGQIKIWDPQTRQELTVVPHPDDSINSVAFSPDGQYLASAADRGFTIWAFHPEQLVGSKLFADDREDCNAVAFSADASILAVGDANCIVSTWEIGSWKKKRELRKHQKAILAIAFSPTSPLLASSATDGNIQIWEENSHLDHSGQVSNSSTVPVCNRPVEGGIVVSADGSRIASYTGGAGGEFLLYDGSTGRPLLSSPKSAKGFTSLTLSSDGTRLISTSTDYTVRTFDATDGELRGIFEGHEDWVRSAAISHDGKHVASASDDKTVRIWELDDPNAEPSVLEGHKDWVRCVAFSPNRRYLASGDDHPKLLVWGKTSSPGSQWCLQHTLFIDQAAVRYQCTETFSFLGRGKSLAFSPDSKGLVALLNDGYTILVLELDTEGEIKSPHRVIKVPQRTETIWFDSRSSEYVMADWGAVSLIKNSLAPLLSDSPPWAPYQLNFDRDKQAHWISWKGEKRILSIPDMYSPECSRVQGHTIILGCRSGHTIVFKFSPDNDPSEV